MRLLLLLLLTVASAHAEVWQARGAGVHLDLNITAESLSYQGQNTRLSFPIKSCNTSLVKQFQDKLHLAGLGDGTFDNRSPLKLKKGVTRVGIASGSPLALLLGTMDERIRMLQKAQELACQS